jgi:ribosomal-protein-alanine N-acetyltransferase
MLYDWSVRMRMPGFETARLAMIPLEADHFEDLYHQWRLEPVFRYLWDGAAPDRKLARSVVQKSIVTAKSSGIGLWTLFERENSKRIVGCCGLVPAETECEAELLYSLHPDFWGHGLASEAVDVAVRDGFERLQLEKIWGRTDPPNAASIRVLERAGFVFAGERQIQGRILKEYVLERGRKSRVTE